MSLEQAKALNSSCQEVICIGLLEAAMVSFYWMAFVEEQQVGSAEQHLPGGCGGEGVAQLGRARQHAVLVGRDLRAERQRPNGVLAQLPYVEQPYLRQRSISCFTSTPTAAWQATEQLPG